MKKIIFLIIASLLVIGLVLPGCEGEGEGFENWITIAVAGPMTFIQGRDHLAGAEMARDEINDAGGVTVDSLVYGIALEEVDTNEILDTSGVTGTTALTAVIDDVDFVVGGFRTEAVTVYREVAMDAGVIFIDDGAATRELCESVLLDYDQYKYFFKGTPYNSTFLFVNSIKQLMSANAKLRAAANMTPGPGTTIALIVEDAEWTGAFKAALEFYLPNVYGFTLVGTTQTPASTDTDLSAELTAIAGAGDPMITMTIISGPPGKAYGMQQAIYLPNTFSTGINVEAQDIDYHHDTGAEYHCTMDTWAEGLVYTAGTQDFWDEFMSRTGRYPTYCAATYDSIKALVEAIEDVGLNTADIITWLENLDNAYTGTAATTGYIPMPAIDLTGLNVTNLDAGLSAAQAYALYPHLPAMYGENYTEMEANWMAHLLDANSSLGGFTDENGFVPHDTVYGPGWQTGANAQWQPVDPEDLEGEWHKVAWWPNVAVPGVGENTPAVDLTPGEITTLLTYGLLDKYGNWNMAYEGTVPFAIPEVWLDHWGP